MHMRYLSCNTDYTIAVCLKPVSVFGIHFLWLGVVKIVLVVATNTIFTETQATHGKISQSHILCLIIFIGLDKKADIIIQNLQQYS